MGTLPTRFRELKDLPATRDPQIRVAFRLLEKLFRGSISLKEDAVQVGQFAMRGISAVGYSISAVPQALRRKIR